MLIIQFFLPLVQSLLQLFFDFLVGLLEVIFPIIVQLLQKIQDELHNILITIPHLKFNSLGVSFLYQPLPPLHD